MLNKLGASGLQSELSHPVGLLSHTLQVMEAAKGTRTGRELGRGEPRRVLLQPSCKHLGEPAGCWKPRL